MQSRTRRLRVCRSASALQRWLANFLKISQFFVFCCSLGLIFAKSQIFDFGDVLKRQTTVSIIFRCPGGSQTSRIWQNIDFSKKSRFSILSSILWNFKKPCSRALSFSWTYPMQKVARLILLIFWFTAHFNWIVKLLRIILNTGQKLQFCQTGHEFC